jgi:hypothetical protein
MWVLIVVGSMSINTTALATVPGFTSQAHCEAAAKQAKEGSTGMVTLRTVCVQVK